jgi:hypothetical protein
MADIFLSYQRSDEQKAELLVHIFKKLGWTVWRDNEIPTATRWQDVIESQLNEAKVILVCWSSSAKVSEWVNREAQYALENKKYIPLTFDGTSPTEPFSCYQATSLRNWHGGLDWPNLKAILRAVAREIGANDSNIGKSVEIIDHFALQRQRSTMFHILAFCTFFYSLAMWIACQQPGFNPGFLIDSRPVPGSVIALVLVSILLIATSRYLFLFAHNYSDENWVRRVPHLGFTLPDDTKPFVRLHAKLLLFFGIVLPALSLIHFGRKVIIYGKVAPTGKHLNIGIDYWSYVPTFNEIFSDAYRIGEGIENAPNGVTFIPFYETYIIIFLVICAWVMSVKALREVTRKRTDNKTDNL